MDGDEVLLDCEDRMEKAVEFLKTEYRSIRSGRASAGLVENIRVEYYGNPTPLKQIAGIAIPEGRLVVVKPFDKNALGDIEKAILKSELGITPMSDGKVIRLQVPPLSEENRRHTVAQVKDMAEQQHVSIRNVRRESIRHIDAAEKEKKMSEDNAETYKEDIQKLTKKYEEKVTEILKAKTEELMED